MGRWNKSYVCSVDLSERDKVVILPFKKEGDLQNCKAPVYFNWAPKQSSKSVLKDLKSIMLSYSHCILEKFWEFWIYRVLGKMGSPFSVPINYSEIHKRAKFSSILNTVWIMCEEVHFWRDKFYCFPRNWKLK